MKKKYFVNLIAYFIIGYILFNFIFVFTQKIILNLLGFSRSIAYIFFENLKTMLIIYLIVFTIIILLDYLYKLKTTKILNDKLKILKERGGQNEK